MDWLSKLEKKYGRYAISNLMQYIIILYGAGFALKLINPEFYYRYLSLDAPSILHGQIWRIITFIMEPPSDSLIFIIFVLMLYYYIGQALEMTWGAFRFNVYFFTGVLFHVIAALLVYLLTGINLQLGTAYLNLSLFLVFAFLYPDVEFRLYFVIPIKVKWLAFIDAAFFVYTIVQAFLPSYGGSIYGIYYKANALAAFVSILNFLIFYISTRSTKHKYIKRRREFEKQMMQARKNVNTVHSRQTPNVHQNANGARHRCAICGATELTHPDAEFRYCSKCNGNYEYCQEHLFTHQHVK